MIISDKVLVISSFLIIVYALAMLVFPPKYESFFGVKTKLTMMNTRYWEAGQKLFAYGLMIMSFFMMSIQILKLDQFIKPFPMVFVVILFYQIIKYFVHRILKNRSQKFMI